MIIVDANLLLFAGVSNFAEHEQARRWLDNQFERQTRVGLPWQSLLTYLRLTTSPVAFMRPQRIEDAWKQIRGWLSNSNTWIPEPTAHHAQVLDEIIKSSNPAGELIEEAHLAALAVEHGLVLCSNDRDFLRFPSLRWFNPLSA